MTSTPSHYDIKALVKELIPQLVVALKDCFEPKITMGPPICSHVPLATGTNITRHPHPVDTTLVDTNKRKEPTYSSSEDVSEGMIQFDPVEGKNPRTKKKKGWPKGTPRKPPA